MRFESFEKPGDQQPERGFSAHQFKPPESFEETLKRFCPELDCRPEDIGATGAAINDALAGHELTEQLAEMLVAIPEQVARSEISPEEGVRIIGERIPALAAAIEGKDTVGIAEGLIIFGIFLAFAGLPAALVGTVPGALVGAGVSMGLADWQAWTGRSEHNAALVQAAFITHGYSDHWEKSRVAAIAALDAESSAHIGQLHDAAEGRDRHVAIKAELDEAITKSECLQTLGETLPKAMFDSGSTHDAGIYVRRWLDGEKAIAQREIAAAPAKRDALINEIGSLDPLNKRQRDAQDALIRSIPSPPTFTSVSRCAPRPRIKTSLHSSSSATVVSA